MSVSFEERTLLAFLQDSWTKHYGTEWAIFIGGACLSGFGLTLGINGLKLLYVPWVVPGFFFCVAGAMTFFYGAAELIFKYRKCAENDIQNQCIETTMNNLCHYKNSGLYAFVTEDDSSSESHDNCFHGRCLYNAENSCKSVTRESLQSVTEELPSYDMIASNEEIFL